ncbi:MAG: 4-hydroxy-3-methylbut-2-enyl diphosphate reductase [Candidatus Omnitrophica bacterium]|nr:4-hydroxy-3-methylbut-2-enyl diphosphate reductase [Candidatus Omnitrophota bacterium]
MKTVTIAKNAGFCFGVKRAINLALNLTSKNTPVYMLGDIVHNSHVVNAIKKAGIKKISKLNKKNPGILLIRAHGETRQTYETAKKIGYSIINATCPMVKEIHSLAQKYESKNYKIIIIGDKNHDEVIAIKGNLYTTPIIISSKKDINNKKLRNISKAAIVVQSTQNPEDVEKLLTKIKSFIENVVFCDTICYPTRQKQKEISTLPSAQDAMIIIGSKNSANTKRLFEISKSLNTNTFWINSKSEIKKSWLKNKQKIGIAAGASTPGHIIEDICSFIKSL